jgi:uncharacterized protein (DUF697 family)
MNKKTLPRAVTLTADDMRSVGSAADSAEWMSAPPANINEPDHAAVVMPLPASPRANADAAWRQKLAHAIVERHVAYSAVGGMIPVPLVNAASITAVIVRMVKVLSDHYGVPFERDRARTVVVGLAMGVFPTGLGAITSSSLFSLVPGANAIGLVTSSLVAAGCTRSIGRIFVEHFESGATLADFPLIERR